MSDDTGADGEGRSFLYPGWLQSEPSRLAGASCQRDAPHCTTCSDEARIARVLRLDQDAELAWVVIADAAEEQEVDISLVDDVVPGALVLVHGGVAIGHMEEAPSG